MHNRLVGAAPAKVNLVLEVTGLRADGYHEIDTILQTLELADEVTLEFGAQAGIRVGGPFASGTPADASNLAWRAAELLAARCDARLDDLAISLNKRIPPAGGLGGGASDAATVLRLLGQHWDASDDVLRDVATIVGSDPVFFVSGGGTARAQGRGEILTPLADIPRQNVVLFVPNSTIDGKTARMFAALDRFPFDAGGVAAAFARGDGGRVSAAEVYNGFERVAFDLFPGLAGIWESVEQRCGEPIHLAGAGPTLFWIGASDSAAAGVAAAASGQNCTVLQTTTRGRV